MDEARERTGLTVAELQMFHGVEQLERSFPDGRREQALRLPVELLPMS